MEAFFSAIVSKIPEDLSYTESHEWVQKKPDGLLRIGITEHAQRELGDVVYLDLSAEGKLLKKEEPFGTIEAVKAVSDLFMPISGKIVAVNEALEEQPELVNSAPYGKGWMIEVSPSDESELKALLDAAAYGATIQ